MLSGVAWRLVTASLLLRQLCLVYCLGLCLYYFIQKIYFIHIKHNISKKNLIFEVSNMSWSHSCNQEETEESSPIILEGKIVHFYEDIIPGVFPRIVGTHWLFEQKPHIVKLSPMGQAIINSLSDIGFWTLPGDLNLVIGTNIRACLVLHENSEGYLTLMPFPCSDYSVMDISKGVGIIGKGVGDPITDLPISFHFQMLIGSPNENEINGWELAEGGIFGPAINIMRTASDNITWESVWDLPPLDRPTHYRPYFVDEIPPRTPHGPIPLARTFFPSNRAPRREDRLAMWFSRRFNWARNPNNAEFDIIRVLAHEIGHALGLGHESATSSCIMRGEIYPGPASHNLCNDELVKLQNLYNLSLV